MLRSAIVIFLSLVLLLFSDENIVYSKEIALTDAPDSKEMSTQVDSTEKAIELIKRQERLFDRLFRTLGAGSYSEFESFMRGENNLTIKKALKIVDNDQFALVMARSETSRIKIVDQGFINQYITGTSRGFLDRNLRQSIEATMTGSKMASYKTLDDDVKPKYLSIVLTSDSGVTSPVMVAPRYGTDIYTFKKNAIRERLTFFPGDSLDHVGNIIGLLNHQAQEPSNLEMIFAPWSRRMLMIPFMLVELDENFFGRPLLSSKDFRVPIIWTKRDHFYWEAQVFGRLTLDMVESFEFRDNPPEGTFLKALKQKKITIYDGRVQPAKLWINNQRTS